MSFNLELKNLTFMINSGISSFIQDDPNPIYNNKIISETTNNHSKINNISDIQTLPELKDFIKNSNVCALKNNAIQSVFFRWQSFI